MIQRKTKTIFGATMAIGLVFVVAGAALACTKYYGKITVSGDGTGNVAKTVEGDPTTDFFQWCESPPAFGASESTKAGFWTTRVDEGLAPSLTVTVEDTDNTSCIGADTEDRLPAGTYKVAISEGYWDESAAGFDTGDEDNCHTLETSSGTGYGTIIDGGGVTGGSGANNGFVVDANGDGIETYNETNSIIENSGVLRPAGTLNGWNTVCVYWPQGNTLTGDYWNPAIAANFKSV